jgi:hypothetical protein
MAKKDQNKMQSQSTVGSVQTVNSEGVAPKRRMSTPAAAWGAYTQIRNANIKRDARFAEIAGIFAGFPPTPPQVMERNSAPDMPNVNLKQFQAKAKAYADNVTAITAKGMGWFEVDAEHDDPQEQERRSKYLTECFNWALKKWDNTGFCNGNQYIYETAARDMQMSLFGTGITFFPDQIDFRWKVIPTRRVLVPEGTRLILDNCPAIFIEDQMSVTQLYAMRKKDGWNEASILRNLYDRVEVMSQTSQRRWTYAEFVNSLRDNDQWLISDFQPIRIVHALTMEFDGTISRSIFTDQYGMPSNPMSKEKQGGQYTSEEAQGFVYDKTKVAERWQQVWIPFADNAGPEGDYHGVKGFGDLIFDQCHLNNCMFNRACFGAILANTLMFKGGSENDIQKMDQITITNMGILYPGLELEQQKFAGDVDAAMSMVNVGTQIMDTNGRLFPQNDKTQGGEAPTATQVSFDRSDQAQFTGQQIDFYRAIGLDVLGAEMYMRLAQPASKYPKSWGGGEVAEEFREMCREYGIPEADLLKVKTVRANRNGGSGNSGVDLWKAQQIMAVATPGAGQLAARKEVVAAVKGWEMVPVFIQDTPEPIPEDVQIGNENLLIQGGKTPQAYGFQDQERHLQSHMQMAGEMANLVAQVDEQGITPETLQDAMKLHTALDSAIEHSGMHVQLMSEVRGMDKRPPLHEQLVKEATKNLQNLSGISAQFGQKIEEVSKQQAAQTQSPEMLKAQQEMQIRAAEAQQEMDLKAQAHQQKLGNMSVRNEAQTQIRIEQHQLALATKEDAARKQSEVKTADAIVGLHHSAIADQQALATQAEKDRISLETEKKRAEMASKPKPNKE